MSMSMEILGHEGNTLAELLRRGSGERLSLRPGSPATKPLALESSSKSRTVVSPVRLSAPARERGGERRGSRSKNSPTNLGGPQEGGKYKHGKTSIRFFSFDGLHVQ